MVDSQSAMDIGKGDMRDNWTSRDEVPTVMRRDDRFRRGAAPPPDKHRGIFEDLKERHRLLLKQNQVGGGREGVWFKDQLDHTEVQEVLSRCGLNKKEEFIALPPTRE